MGWSGITESRIIILSTMWLSGRKMINRTTKIKMGGPGDERREAKCTGRRVASLSDEQREMAWQMFLSMILKADNYQQEEEEEEKI